MARLIIEQRPLVDDGGTFCFKRLLTRWKRFSLDTRDLFEPVRVRAMCASRWNALSDTPTYSSVPSFP
jgi:hypothetical protein